MGFFNVIKNEVKAAVGYQQNFTALLEAKDISRALNYMQDRSGFAEKALLEYKVENHEVMKRQDKAVYDKKGNFLRWQKRWKIPIPYQSFINEIALVFLYGRPVKWTQRSKGTDYAFEQYIKLLEHLRFNANVREAKRVAPSFPQWPWYRRSDPEYGCRCPWNR